MQRARGPECGAVSRRGLARGCVSRAFTPADLAAAAAEAHAECCAATRVVYVDVDGAGRLSARGGGAALASRARLAPHAAACNALLEWAPAPHGSGRGVRVRVRQALAPHEELLLWPDEALAADADVPYLTPNNVDGLGLWLCPSCGARFPHPNPLKAHLYLGCAAGEAVPAHALWRRLAEALRDRPPRPAPGASLAAVAEAWSLWRCLPRAGGPPHLCLYCGRCYSRRYGLKIHLRTHTGHKPLHCPHCARAFADPSNLNKHVRLHRRDAPGPRRDTMCAALCTPE